MKRTIPAKMECWALVDKNGTIPFVANGKSIAVYLTKDLAKKGLVECAGEIDLRIVPCEAVITARGERS